MDQYTQITNLTLLAPAIQEDILALPGGRSVREIVTEREMRSLTAKADWEEQQRDWAGLQPPLPRSSVRNRHEGSIGEPTKSLFPHDPSGIPAS